MRVVTLTFNFEDDDFDSFLRREEVNGDLHDWLFAEFCQNHDFGFLSDMRVETVYEQKPSRDSDNAAK